MSEYRPISVQPFGKLPSVYSKTFKGGEYDCRQNEAALLAGLLSGLCLAAASFRRRCGICMLGQGVLCFCGKLNTPPRPSSILISHCYQRTFCGRWQSLAGGKSGVPERPI